MTSGTINGSWVSTILRDTGCTSIIVSDEVLPDIDVSHCEMVRVADYLGRVDFFPKVKCFLRCPYFEGWVDVIRAPIKICSVLVGNIPGVKTELDSSCESVSNPPLSTNVCTVPGNKDSNSNDSSENVLSEPGHEKTTASVQTVQTRSAKGRKLHPLVVPSIEPLKITPHQFADLQQECSTLITIREKSESGDIDETKDGNKFKYENINCLLYRKCIQSKKPGRVGKLALVVPLDCRNSVLATAHEGLLSGHFSHRKTETRVKEEFHWPGITTDIRDYCRSCDKCQRLSTKGRVKPVPLKPMPILTEPFSRVAIDLVGPLNPPSSEGHRYILTLINFATGFPETMPLKDMSSITVAESLIAIFSRVGIPKEILSDNGTQFKSDLMKELHRLLGVKPLFTTPFHPSGNGRIERFHSTLKSSLRKVCEDKPKYWHRYLSPLMFAMREMPSDRTGFSAFELLYGRQVRGPLSVLRDLWEDRHVPDDDRPLYQYFIELKEKLSDCAKIAAQNSNISAHQFKTYFDVKAQGRKFKPGDEVLVLLPDDSRKLLMAWRGPYKVLECKNKVNYLIDEQGKPKLYHANLLKKYFRRAQISMAYVRDEVTGLDFEDQPLIAQVCVERDVSSDSELDFPSQDFSISPEITEAEISSELSTDQKDDVKQIIEDFKDVFSNTPGGGYRMAIDYRVLNAVTEFHAEPMCKLEDDLHKLSGAKYYSELDLTKAYYQVPLTERARPLTAFPTHKGLMEFCRMPFGLVTACATFIRLMRLVLAGLENVTFYFDNVLVFADTWEKTS